MTQALPRRDFLLLPLALACPPLASALPDTQTTHAHYRIDVAIAPLGFTIFASLSVQCYKGCQTIAIEFGGASNSERTRGISQIGHFEEDLTQTRSSHLSSHYFGFISSIPESAPNQVALNLVADSKDKPQYCRAVFTKTCEAPLPGGLNFSTLRQFMRRRLATICETACLQGTRDANPAKTFLSVLADAAFGPSNRIQTDYQYGDRVLHFDSTRQNNSGQIVVDAEVHGKTRHRFSITCPDTQYPAFYAQEKWLRLSLEAVPTPQPVKETL